MVTFDLAKPSDKGFVRFVHPSGTFTTCSCMAQWLPVAEQLGLMRGLIKHNLDIIQLTGDAPASKGTHRRGGAFDIKQRSDAWVAIFRQMGAPASWRRDTGVFANNQHLHGVLNGCSHNLPVRYQLEAQRKGKNGLNPSSRDPSPSPTPRRTWREGIAWAQQQLGPEQQTARLQHPEEDIMASIDELRKVIREELRGVPNAVWQIPLDNHDTDPDDGVRPKKFAAQAYPIMANWRAAQNQLALANVTKLLGDINGKVTDKALAASLAKVLAPIVRHAALDVGVAPAIADKLVEKVNAQLGV
ncbi:hypothetical protein [Terrabacter sp. Root181]|uniref:hypothetical protein n=1 Tax=Terrabacter sp. Root181 TaxID=1736484 RepID=UPI0006F2E9B3|nr:hypothetical protein [Terrabacter sp. Root181]KRB46535.1 hypothetical protein ASD90_22655 [Terrabacter sp. Root181]